MLPIVRSESVHLHRDISWIFLPVARCDWFKDGQKVSGRAGARSQGCSEDPHPRPLSRYALCITRRLHSLRAGAGVMAASRRVKTLPHFLEAPSGLACRRGLGPGVLLGSPGRACRWRDSTEQRGVWGYRGRYASPWRRRPACAPAATSGT